MTEPHPTQIPVLKRWLRNSQVVGQGRKPLLVYHGTDKDFVHFDIEHVSDKESEGGFFFTPDRCRAEPYGDRIIEAYIRLENPYTIDPLSWMEGSGPSVEEMKEAGHDGIIIDGDPTSASEPEWEFGADVYIVFSSDQIRFSSDFASELIAPPNHDPGEIEPAF